MLVFRGEGTRIRWANTTGVAVVSGEVVPLGNMIGVAVAAIAIGGTGVLNIKMVHELAATAAEIWAPGDPLYWNTTTDKLSLDGGANIPAGHSVNAKVATVTTGQVDLHSDIPRDFQDRVWENVAAIKTYDAEDCGKVMNVTADAFVITLPATVIGYEYITRNGMADGGALVTISPDANDKIAGPDLAGADNKDRLNTKATALQGDYTRLVADGAVGWYIRDERGTWVAEGA